MPMRYPEFRYWEKEASFMQKKHTRVSLAYYNYYKSAASSGTMPPQLSVMDAVLLVGIKRHKSILYLEKILDESTGNLINRVRRLQSKGCIDDVLEQYKTEIDRLKTSKDREIKKKRNRYRSPRNYKDFLGSKEKDHSRPSGVIVRRDKRIIG